MSEGEVQKWSQLQPQVEISSARQNAEITQNSSQIQHINSEQKFQEKVQKTNAKGHSYRPDIDGLRTIAISTVVIFHAFPEFMTGGFIGVDVFFVISGYLITNIIIKETLKNEFSIINFYCRRVKRIYPALIIILVFVLSVIPKFYVYDQLSFALKTLVSSVFFGANLQIMTHNKHYFDSDIQVNPLLHLWSLGVQQQFYIIWPCLVALSLKFLKGKTGYVLSFYSIASFAFGIYSVYNNTKFAFYFPLCRFWQMAIGGMLAYFNLKIMSPKINNFLSFLGVAAILRTIWILNDQSLFPGFWALIPTLSSACIIQAGERALINKYILSNKVMVFIGKISYPLYLWHWPLLVFSRYFFRPQSDSIYANLYFIIGLAVLLSILTYLNVERPLSKIKSKYLIVSVLLILMALVGTWGYTIYKNLDFHDYYIDRKQTMQILDQANKNFGPRSEDYVLIKGRMQPNLSKSKNRKYPTVQKLKIPILSHQFQMYERRRLKSQPLILQKKITNLSKYYMEDDPGLHHFEVTNQGRKHQVFYLGDSHGQKIGYRLQKLYSDSVKEKKQKDFPTIVSIIKRGQNILIPSGKNVLDFAYKLIQKHRPNRVLLSYFWDANKVRKFSLKNATYYNSGYPIIFQQMVNFVKSIQKLGVKVYSTTVDLTNKKFDPRNMIDFYGVVDKSLQPVSLTDFRKKNKKLYELIDTKLKKIGVQIIDLTDNLCWQGVCEVTSPKGQGIFQDLDHVGTLTAKYWLSSIDHIVKF